jgi:hypothetical protein
MRQELQTFAQNFDNVTQGKSVEAKWELFESTMQNIINNCIPHKLSSSRYNLPWFTRSLRRQTRKKQKLYNKAKASGNESAWAKFREPKRSLSRNLKAARESYVRDILGESIKENPKTFWSYIKKLSKDNVGVSDFEINGKIVDDSKQKAEFLSKIFSSVFTKENPNNHPEHKQTCKI